MHAGATAELRRASFTPDVYYQKEPNTVKKKRGYIIYEYLGGNYIPLNDFANIQERSISLRSIVGRLFEFLKSAQGQKIVLTDLKPEHLFVPRDENTPIKCIDYQSLYSPDGSAENEIQLKPGYTLPYLHPDAYHEPVRNFLK